MNLIRRKGIWFIGDVIQLAFCLPVIHSKSGLRNKRLRITVVTSYVQLCALPTRITVPGGQRIWITIDTSRGRKGNL